MPFVALPAAAALFYAAVVAATVAAATLLPLDCIPGSAASSCFLVVPGGSTHATAPGVDSLPLPVSLHVLFPFPAVVLALGLCCFLVPAGLPDRSRKLVLGPSTSLWARPDHVSAAVFAVACNFGPDVSRS